MDELNDIIAGCRQNDRICQEKLYRQFFPPLYALCKKFFDDNHEVLTALNNGMLRVYKNIGQYDSSKGEFFNWVYTIIRNSALTLIRGKKAEPIVELDKDISEIVDYNPFIKADWKDIYKYLDRLPSSTRAVCSLFYMEGFSIKEISSSLQMKDGTVKWHLNESRNKLKEIFIKNYHL